MTRPRFPGPLFSFWGAALLGLVPPIHAETPAPSTSARAGTAELARPELIVLQALQANPITAPYGLSTAYRNGQVVLSGAVGTKQIHDVAIRIAIASGYPIRDDLVIDTAAAHRVAASVAATGIGPVGMAGTMAVPALGAAPGAIPYVYPPPLFGRIDDPFFGFEPPLVSYPPWWRAVAARAAINASATANPAPKPVAGPATTVSPGSASTIPVPLGTSPQAGTIEMTIDPRGFAVLRGTVPTLEDLIAIGQKIAQTQGVSEVLNLLTVAPGIASASETPPPPPQPALNVRPQPPAPQPAPAPEAERTAPRPGIAVDREGGDLAQRLGQALARRPALANLPIKVTVHDGVASLSGSVPTVYEAMLAFRAVQQTPGVREVLDRLEFVVPDGERKNPLLDKGRPEDVEPYLLAQVRRHVGDLAHVDQLRLRGDRLEIHGTLPLAEDQPRFEAILRSIPILRGFQLEPIFTPE
jgi:hypothetical protein